MDTSFKGNIGALSAPDVVIESREENRNSIFVALLEEVKCSINHTAERADNEAFRNVIKFKQDGVEKRVLILKCQKKGYSLNMSWDGETMIFDQNNDGNITIASERYHVYYLDEAAYKNEKMKRAATKKGVILEEMDGIEQREFMEYFREEQ